MDAKQGLELMKRESNSDTTHNNSGKSGWLGISKYKRFKKSLPDNLKNTSEREYAMRYYWKKANKPRDFNESLAMEQPMFTKESDGLYHAPSVEPNTLRFLKPKSHKTVQYELDWYNSSDPNAVDFRNKYALDSIKRFFRYIPRKKN